MEYGYRVDNYSFDEESPRYSLRSLWFLLGVMVFAFTVLIVASALNGAGSGPAHITSGYVKPVKTVQQPPRTGGRGVNANATPATAPVINSKGAQIGN